MAYDSAADTLKHIKRVQDCLHSICGVLMQRGTVHDKSKLGHEEKPYFDEHTPALSASSFGSAQYRERLALMRPAVDHHNAHNSHHPEFYHDGVAGMDIFDLVEMFCDWKAASERHASGSIERSVEICVERFKIEPQLAAILRNTASRHKFT